MIIRSGFCLALLYSAVVVLALPAKAGDAIDTRVSFTIADDDVAKGPQESIVGSPSLPNMIPNDSNRLFFDDFERRDSGFENLTHLVLYAHQPGFFAGLDTEASLVLRAQVKENGEVILADSGSYLRLTKALGDLSLALTAFPIKADRFQLGYSYDIAWGGSSIFKNSKAVPGFRIDLDADEMWAFIGAKTSLGQIIQDDNTIEQDTVWGILGGAGVDVLDELRMEANGGFFHRGVIDKTELKEPDPKTGRLNTAPWDGFGGSAQITYHIGIPIGVPIDFRLYRNDPLQHENFFFKPEKYNDDVSFMVRSEISTVGQTLQDPDLPNSTTIQWGVAGDLTAQVKVGKARFHALGVYRDLAFILFDVPSLSPFVDFPDGIGVEPEFFGSIGMDYFIESWHLTPGFNIGIQRPANVSTSVVGGADTPRSLGQTVMVIRSPTDFQPMDPGDEVALITAGKLTTKWQLSEIMNAAGELQVSHDPNRRRLQQDPLGIPHYADEEPWIVGFTLLLQARF